MCWCASLTRWRRAPLICCGSRCCVPRSSARGSGRARARDLGQPPVRGPGEGRIEIYRSRLHPHDRSQVSSHGTGSVEYVSVLSGSLTLVVDDVSHQLETGDAARFSGLSSHYYTTRDRPAVTQTVVSYSGD
ncbi:cupin domain-containing protein [Streptomyces sp. M10(2022)]